MNMEIPKTILPKERADRRRELQEMNKQNKDVIADLNVVLDSFDNVDIVKRRDDLVKNLDKQIEEIKTISFEKAVIINARYRFAEDLLSQLDDQPELLQRLEEINQVRQERAGKHAKRFGIDSEIFYQKVAQKNKLDLSKIDQEIAKTIRAVQSLQKLVETDSELKDQYITLLAEASDKLSTYELDKEGVILEKAKDVLEGLPFSEELIAQIDDLDRSLEKDKEEDAIQRFEQVDWEIMPSDGKDYDLKELDFEDMNCGKNWRDYERIKYIMGLSPRAVYSSKQFAENRAYNAYEFDNCVIMASVWSKHAVYVIPNVEGWQTMSGQGKKELRFRGAIVLKQVNGWKERLERIINGEVNVHIDEESEFLEWSKDENELIDQVRKRILAKFPELNKALSEGRIDDAKEIVINMSLVDMEAMGIKTGTVHYIGLFRDLKMQCFPELKLQKSDIPNSHKKKFNWKTKEESIHSFRTGIFDAFPEIKEALDNDDLDSAAEYLQMLDDNDLMAIGLRVVAQGKNQFLTSRSNALEQSFPEITSGAFKSKRGRGQRYENDEDKFNKWGFKLKKLFLEKDPIIKDTLETDPQKTKVLILRAMEKEGGPSNFLRANISSIFGVKNFGGYKNYLKYAFPEISWE